MRNKISSFLFPVKTNKIDDNSCEFYLTCRFGILSVILWDLYCRIFGND